MTLPLPPIDLHAHVDPAISGDKVDALNAVVFAVTRSLDEAEAALSRNDDLAIWGVGCHPAVASSQKAFSAERFRDLLKSTCFAGELGLDGTRGNPARQVQTLRAALDVLRIEPRIVSLHSAGAPGALLDELERMPIAGAVLHWWLGAPAETRRAVELGCYFSLNRAGVSRNDILSLVPLQRLLSETDHPFGDRRSRPQQPGNVQFVEGAIARLFGLGAEEVRRQMWANLATVVQQTRCGRLVPRAVRHRLATVTPNAFPPSSTVGSRRGATDDIRHNGAVEES